MFLHFNPRYSNLIDVYTCPSSLDDIIHNMDHSLLFIYVSNEQTTNCVYRV